MYYDLTTDELQAWLLAEGMLNDTVLAPDSSWNAAQMFRIEIRDQIAYRQCGITDEELLEA